MADYTYWFLQYMIDEGIVSGDFSNKQTVEAYSFLGRISSKLRDDRDSIHSYMKRQGIANNAEILTPKGFSVALDYVTFNKLEIANNFYPVMFTAYKNSYNYITDILYNKFLEPDYTIRLKYILNYKFRWNTHFLGIETGNLEEHIHTSIKSSLALPGMNPVYSVGLGFMYHKYSPYHLNWIGKFTSAKEFNEYYKFFQVHIDKYWNIIEDVNTYKFDNKGRGTDNLFRGLLSTMDDSELFELYKIGSLVARPEQLTGNLDLNKFNIGVFEPVQNYFKGC